MRLKFSRDAHRLREEKMRDHRLTKTAFVLYVAAAACIILSVPAADWMATVIENWMGINN